MDKNHSVPSVPIVEGIRLQSGDLGTTCLRLAKIGEPAEMDRCWVWGWMQGGVDTPPLMHLRTFSKIGLIGSHGFTRLAATPLERNEFQKYSLLLHSDDETVKYMPGDQPGLWQLKGTNPVILCSFSADRLHLVESDLLDVNYELFPYAMLAHSRCALGTPYLHQHALITGTFKGKPVRYLGGFDRCFGGDFAALKHGNLFAGLSFAGVHIDGCREWEFVARIGREGGIGFYCKDGEEPVISDGVKFIADWKKIPYADNDVWVFTEADFGFGGKVIHYKAKWGMMGLDGMPRKHGGMTQSSGYWYEGDTPYRFDLSLTYCESHNAFSHNIPL